VSSLSLSSCICRSFPLYLAFSWVLVNSLDLFSSSRSNWATVNVCVLLYEKQGALYNCQSVSGFLLHWADCPNLLEGKIMKDRSQSHEHECTTGNHYIGHFGDPSNPIIGFPFIVLVLTPVPHIPDTLVFPSFCVTKVRKEE